MDDLQLHYSPWWMIYSYTTVLDGWFTFTVVPTELFAFTLQCLTIYIYTAVPAGPFTFTLQSPPGWFTFTLQSLLDCLHLHCSLHWTIYIYTAVPAGSFAFTLQSPMDNLQLHYSHYWTIIYIHIAIPNGQFTLTLQSPWTIYSYIIVPAGP